jgi:hypothetical protein
MADKTIDAMEDDIKRMAGNLRPVVGAASVLGTTLGKGLDSPMPDARERVTVSHIHKALDALTSRAAEEANAAWAMLGLMTGANESGQPKLSEGAKAAGPVFEGMARQIVDVTQQLDRLRKAREAMQRVLS